MAGSEEGSGPLRPFPETGDLDAAGEGPGREWLLYDPETWKWQDIDADETEAADEDEPAPKPGKRPARGRDAYHAVGGWFDPENLSFGLELGGSPWRMSLWPSRKKCPACLNSGPRPVITRVSLGTSAAVKVLSEGLLEALPEHAADPKKRLLVFSDSRQDAAHQARFIAYARRYDRMRHPRRPTPEGARAAVDPEVGRGPGPTGLRAPGQPSPAQDWPAARRDPGEGCGPGRKPRCWTTWPSTRATGRPWRTWA